MVPGKIALCLASWRGYTSSSPILELVPGEKAPLALNSPLPSLLLLLILVSPPPQEPDNENDYKQDYYRK